MHWQNLLVASYAALGLVHTLNPLASGGSERDEAATTIAQIQPVASIPNGYGKIIRDSSGNVLRIELPDDQGHDPDQNGKEEPQLDDPQLNEDVISKWVNDLGGSKSSAPNHSITKGESLNLFLFSHF